MRPCFPDKKGDLMHRPRTPFGDSTKAFLRAPLAILLGSGLACASAHLGATDPGPSVDELLDESSEDSPGTQVFRVMATESISEKDLGRPCDEKFQFLPGEASEPIFDAASKPRNHPTTSAGYVQFGNTREVDVALGIWGLDVGAGEREEQRYGLYRMHETKKVIEVDDRGKGPRAVPEGAQWYVGAIYFGYSIEEFTWGNRHSFHAGVGARLATKNLGKFHALVSQYQLSSLIRARGLEGTEQQLQTIRSLDDLANYRRAPDPVPILVEYRSIPGVQPDLGEPIAQTPIPPSFYKYSVQLESVHVTNPRQCRGNCNVVVRVQGSGSSEEGAWIEGPRGTSDPPFGGKELIHLASDEELRQGFTMQVQDNSPEHPGLGLCQLTTNSDQLDKVANTKDKVLEVSQKCDPFVVLKLRLLAKQESDVP